MQFTRIYQSGLNMKLSLSVRVAEQLSNKRNPEMSLNELSELASDSGYHALCMRASQLGIQTPLEDVKKSKQSLDKSGLKVSMVTGDFPIPENTDDAPKALRNITPYLDLAEALDSDLLRIGMKTDSDISWAQAACDEAKERGMRLAHQCHTASLFEQVKVSMEIVKAVGRENFGIIYEPANLVQCGEDYGRDTLKLFAPHIFNVYFQNLKESPNGESLADTWKRGKVRFDQVTMWGGTGINFLEIMDTLTKIGYEGYVTLHQSATPPATPEEFVKETARYLKGLAKFD